MDWLRFLNGGRQWSGHQATSEQSHYSPVANGIRREKAPKYVHAAMGNVPVPQTRPGAARAIMPNGKPVPLPADRPFPTIASDQSGLASPRLPTVASDSTGFPPSALPTVASDSTGFQPPDAVPSMHPGKDVPRAIRAALYSNRTGQPSQQDQPYPTVASDATGAFRFPTVAQDQQDVPVENWPEVDALPPASDGPVPPGFWWMPRRPGSTPHADRVGSAPVGAVQRGGFDSGRFGDFEPVTPLLALLRQRR